MLHHLFSIHGIISLLTLTLLEVILGIDNIVMIVVFASKLPKSEQNRARRIGLLAALVSRIFLLFCISWLLGINTPLFEFLDKSFSIKDIILILGGTFLLIKAVTEIYKNVERPVVNKNPNHNQGKLGVSLIQIVMQILFVDIIFSLDSVMTAVGVTQDIVIMILAVIIAVAVMIIFVDVIGDFIENHPSSKILALAFLVLIGVLLVGEGLGEHMNKAYIYFAMAFSVIIEILNMRYYKKSIKK